LKGIENSGLFSVNIHTMLCFHPTPAAQSWADGGYEQIKICSGQYSTAVIARSLQAASGLRATWRSRKTQGEKDWIASRGSQ